MNVKIACDTRYDEALKAKLEKLLGEHGLNIEYVETDYDILLSDKNAESQQALNAHLNGKAVFLDAEDFNALDAQDIAQGYIGTDEWYAKHFANPIIIANTSHLEMRLGATINPRAIILNNGLEGKGGHVFIDRGTHIGADCLLNLGPTDFKTGKFSLISANFSAHAMRHTTGHISNYALKKGPFAFMGDVYEDAAEIKIGHDVWIGEGVTCLPGVEIATGSVIGAGSVVTRSTEPYGIYAGNPAKLLRKRFDEDIIEILHKSAWWDYPYERLKDIQDIFRQDIQNMNADQLQEILQC